MSHLVQRIKRLRSNIADRESLARELISATLGSAAIRVAGMAMTFLVGVQLARYLKPGGYGIYGTVTAIGAILIVPAQLGFSQLITKEISAFMATSNFARVRGAILWFTKTVFVASLAVAGVGFFVFSVLPIAHDQVYARAFYVGLLTIPILALTNLAISMLRGFHLVVSGQMFDALVRPALFALLLLLAFSTSMTVNAVTAIWLQVIAGLITLIICGWKIVRHIPTRVAAADSSLHYREWVTSAAPMMGTEALRALDGQYGMLVLGVIATVSQAGVFRVALAIAGLISLPSTLINLVVMPYLSTFHAGNEHDRLQRLATGAAVSMVALVWSITIALFLFGQPAISLLFGRAFAGAWLPVCLIGIAYSINASCGCATNILNMCGHEKTVTVAHAVGLIIGASLTFGLFRYLGVAAVGTAMIVSESVKSTIMWSVALRKMKIDTSIFSLRLFATNSLRKPLIPSEMGPI